MPESIPPAVAAIVTYERGLKRLAFPRTPWSSLGWAWLLVTPTITPSLSNHRKTYIPGHV